MNGLPNLLNVNVFQRDDISRFGSPLAGQLIQVDAESPRV